MPTRYDGLSAEIEVEAERDGALRCTANGSRVYVALSEAANSALRKGKDPDGNNRVVFGPSEISALNQASDQMSGQADNFQRWLLDVSRSIDALPGATVQELLPATGFDLDWWDDLAGIDNDNAMRTTPSRVATSQRPETFRSPSGLTPSTDAAPGRTPSHHGGQGVDRRIPLATSLRLFPDAPLTNRFSGATSSKKGGEG